MSASEHTIQTPDKVQTAEEIAKELAAEQAAAAADAPEAPQGDRPAWLPEKFKSPEDMAKAYSELEKKQSSAPKDKKAEPESPQKLSIEKAEKAAEDAGLDFETLAAKYAEKGKLEEEDYKALEKSGLKRETVDTYIRGQEALAAQYESQIMEKFGSREEYQTMIQWASTNLSEAQIDLFNEATSSGNVDKALFAINALKAQYTSAVGNEPARTVDGRPSQGGPRYESEAEYIKDMENPEYWNNPVYRDRVDRKFASTWGG